MVKELESKKVPRPSYGLKIVHGSPVSQFPIFGETERFVHNSSTFNVSVYAPYHATRFVRDNEFAGKEGERRSNRVSSKAVLPRK